MTKKDEPAAPEPNHAAWTGAAAMAGAAIGSAAVAAALLFASRRRDRAEKARTPAPPVIPPETD